MDGNETLVNDNFTSTENARKSDIVLGIILILYSIPFVALNSLCVVGLIWSKSIKATPYKLLITHVSIAQTEQLVVFCCFGGIFKLFGVRVSWVSVHTEINLWSCRNEQKMWIIQESVIFRMVQAGCWEFPPQFRTRSGSSTPRRPSCSASTGSFPLCFADPGWHPAAYGSISFSSIYMPCPGC